MQPRWLVSQLEELDYQTDYQMELASSLVFETQQLHAITQNFLELAKADVFAVHELYETLVMSYEAALEHAQMRNTRVEHQVEVATNTLNYSEQSLEESRDLQAFWYNQEHKADVWLSSANTHLHRCTAQRIEAESKLASAKAELARAQSALNHVRSLPPRKVYRGRDRNGNDLYDYEPVSTYQEEARVSRAQSSVSQRNGEVNSALSAESAARIEVTRATTQLNGSRYAIKDAKNATHLAEQAREVATHTKRESQYSQSYSKECLETLEKINLLLIAFKETCEQQTSLIGTLSADTNDAFLYLKSLEGQQESLQDQAFSLKYTLQDKISLLLSYDQPLTMAG